MIPDPDSESEAVGDFAAPRAADVAEFQSIVVKKLTYMVGKDQRHAREHDWFVATALAARDHIVDRWMDATRRTYRDGRKRVYYFSLEFLIGRLLFDALAQPRASPRRRAQALRELGVDLDRLRKLEPDAALGNGGLGRLAACFMESMATLRHPGARLRHPLRPRHLPPGAQGRLAARAARGLAVLRQSVGVRAAGGRLHGRLRRHRRRRRARADGTTRYGLATRPRRVNAVAYDTPIVGWRGRHVNTLRLWSARAADPLSPRGLQPRRPRRRAGRPRAARRAISRVLYPSDDTAAGPGAAPAAGVSSSPRRRCRTCCAGTRRSTASSRSLPDHVGDPAQRHASGDRRPRADAPPGRRARHAVGRARGRSRPRCFNYTNHTLLPEALETLAGAADGAAAAAAHADHLPDQRAAPRRAARGRARRRRRSSPSVSLIDENHGRRVRMGHLAFLGSHRVNGVSALHTELMRQTVFRDLQRALSRPHRQQDQRHHLPPLAVPGESRR